MTLERAQPGPIRSSGEPVPHPQGSDPIPDSEITYKDSKARRWGKTLFSKVAWTGATYLAGFGGIVISKPLEHMTSTAATMGISAGIYAGMAATLVAVGERVTHKQVIDGYSPSWGAMAGHSSALKEYPVPSRQRLINKTYRGYSVELAAEEAFNILLTVPVALQTDAKTTLAFAAGSAGMAIVTNVAKHLSLREASGPPILFPRTREKLQVKRRVTEAFRGR